MVTGQTGKVKGERPWSRVKVALAVLLVLAIAGALAYQWGAANGCVHVNSF